MNVHVKTLNNLYKLINSHRLVSGQQRLQSPWDYTQCKYHGLLSAERLKI